MPWITPLVRRLVRTSGRTVRRPAARPLRLTVLEDRVTPTVDVWTGASSNLWSDGGNWQDTSAPTAGEDLVFPAGATNQTAVYDSGLGVSNFGSIDIQGSGYDISTSFASLLTLTAGLSATYGSSISNFDIDFDPGNGTISVGSGATLELAGVVAGTSGLAASGGGTLQLAGTSSNTYSGTTTVANATTLVLDKSSATAVPGNLTISAGGTVQLAQSDQITNSSLVTEGSGATLDLNDFDEAVSGLNLTGATVATGTGTLTLLGNVTTNSASTTSVISGNLDLGGATRAFTVANNAQLDPDLSITADISGTGAGLTKLGANSQLLLSGNNTYDGTTTIAAGAVEVASDNALGAASAGTVVNSGFSVAPLGGITVPEPFTISGAGFGGLGAIFNGNGNNTLTGPITLGAASTIGSLSGTLIFSGAISDGAGSFALTKVLSGAVALTGANTYDGATTVNAGVLRVDGTITSAVVLAGGTLSGSGTVDGSGVTATAASTINPGSVGGPGVLTYANATGFTVPSSATLHIDINGTTVGTGYDQLKLTDGSALFNPNGATLDVALGYLPTVNTSFQIVSQAYSFPITGRFNGISQFGSLVVGPVTFSVGYFNSGVILTVTAVTAPTATWDGGGATNNWSEAANWVGDTAPSQFAALVFPAGAQRPTNANDLAAGFTFSSVTIAAAGYAVMGNAVTVTGGISSTYASGTSAFGLDTALTATEAVDVAAGGTLELSGAISGPGFGLTKTGGGTLRFAGIVANSFTGTTTVADGTLELVRDPNLAVIPGTLVVGDGVGAGEAVRVVAAHQIADTAAVTVNEGATFQVGNNETVGALTLQGATVSIDAGRTLTLTTSITSNATTNNVTSTIQGPGTLDLSNTMIPLAVADDADLAVDLRIAATVQDGGITKSGAGVMALSGTNTFDGDTAVIAGGIQVESAAALGTTAGATTVASGASVFFSGPALAVAEPFSVAGTGLASSGALATLSGSAALSGAVTMTANAQIGTTSGATLALSGVIDDGAGTFGLAVLQAATGRTVLGGSNLFDGTVTATSGYLRVAHANGLGDPATGTAVTVEDGATLELSGGITLPATKSLVFQLNGAAGGVDPKLVNVAGSNTVAGAIAQQGNEEYGVAAGTSLTLSGVVSESGGARNLLKAGAGTLVLSATNTYSGGTFLNDGTLRVDGSIAASIGVTVASGATLGGTGTLPAVTAASGATVAPGTAGPGTLTSGAATLAGDSTFAVELNGTTVGTQYDRLAVTGAADLTGATLSVSLGFAPVPGDAFTIVSNDAADAVTGTFAGLAEGATFTVGGTAFRISYAGGTGNDVVLTVIGTPTVGVTSSAATTVTGQAVTFTAAVSGAGATPTGSVSLVVDGVTVETFALAAGSRAFTPLANLTVGTHTVSVSYAGNPTYLGGTGTLAGGQVVNQASTATAVTTSASPTVYGQSVTLTATAAAVAPGAGTPTGTAAFFDGATLLGTGTLNGAGVATLTTSALAVGSHSVTAVFSGDAGFAGSSGQVNQAVSTASTTAAVSSTGATVFGQPATFTATVSAVAPGAGTPTGSVSFYDGATLLGSAALNGSGAASVTTTALPVGSHTITAEYGGAAFYAASTGSLPGAPLVVGPAGTVTAVVSSLPTSTYGGSVTFTVAVSAAPPGSGTPAGTVAFLDGSTVLTTTALDGSGVAAYTTSALTASGSPHPITAVFTPAGGNFSPSDSSGSPVPQTVNQATLTVSADDLTREYGSGNPTLTVTFAGFKNGETLATSGVTGSPALATAADPASPVGGSPYLITAAVGTLAAGNYTFSLAGGALAVTPALLTITAADQSKVFGGPVPALTASYAGFVNGETPAVLAAPPVLTTTAAATSPVAGGPYAITAGGAAADNYAIRYVPGRLAVTPAGTTTAVPAAGVPSRHGRPATFTAAVAAVAPGAGAPTGTVTFTAGGVVLGTAPVVNGVARLTTTALPVGRPTVTATYHGDAGFTGSTGAAAQTVAPDPSDATGDGRAEVAAGGATAGSRVTVFDPATGRPVTGFEAFEGFAGGVSVAMADVDGDGRAEVVVGAGAGGGPVVKVFDARTGALVRSFLVYEDSFRGGINVAAADLDGDGRAEVIAGSGVGGGPVVRVFDGLTGSLRGSFLAYEASFRGGVVVAAGDLDGDGRAEVIAGAGVGGAPRVTVFGGADLAEVASYFAFDPSFRGGVNVTAGDVDGDGRLEVVAGAGAGGAPHVKVLDGRTGDTRTAFYAFDPSFRGGVSVAAGDTDGDGRADVIAGAGRGAGAHVQVFDGVSGDELESFFAFDDFLGGVDVG